MPPVTGLLQLGAQAAVGGDAPGQGQLSEARILERQHGLVRQLVAHCLAEGGRQVGGRHHLAAHFLLVDRVQEGGLQAGEAEVVLTVRMGMRQLQRLVVALVGQPVQPRAAGIGQVQHAGRLVEGLARRVVLGAADQAVDAVVLHREQVAVPTADRQAQEGRLQLRKGQVVGADVPLDVVHRHQGLSAGKGQALHVADADQQRAHQARAAGHRQGVDSLQRHPRLPERGVHDLAHLLHMGAGGDLRHHAAVQGVQVDLRIHRVGQDLPPVLHHGRRRLVAGSLQRQDADVFLIFQRFRAILHFLDVGHRSSLCPQAVIHSRVVFSGHRYPAGPFSARPAYPLKSCKLPRPSAFCNPGSHSPRMTFPYLYTG